MAKEIIIKSVKVSRELLDKYERKAKKEKRTVHYLMVESLQNGITNGKTNSKALQG